MQQPSDRFDRERGRGRDRDVPSQSVYARFHIGREERVWCECFIGADCSSSPSFILSSV